MESFTNKWVLDTSLGANLSLNLFDNHSNSCTNSVLTSPSPSVNSISGSKDKIHLQVQDGKLEEELKRMKVEKKQLTQKMATMHENFEDLQMQLIGLMSGTSQFQSINFNMNKRNTADNNNNNNYNIEQSCINSLVNDDYCLPCKRARLLSSKPKVFRTFIRTHNSDSSQVVKDGYEWRKYGQKVTRDNPSPRAYFKCAQAPICPVKKKVQRSVDDPNILVATYEGEHNHAKPNSSNYPTDDIIILDTNQCPNLCNNHSKNNNEQKQVEEMNTKALQRLLVDKMATSLCRDPCFISALAKAISQKIMNTDLNGRWL